MKTLIKKVCGYVGLALLGLGNHGAVVAQQLVDRAETPRVQSTMLSSMQLASQGSTLSIALHREIMDGWHTYWENPGDSGEPITIDWELPDGVTVGDIHYPVPHAIAVGPLMNYGYAVETTLLPQVLTISQVREFLAAL